LYILLQLYNSSSASSGVAMKEILFMQFCVIMPGNLMYQTRPYDSHGHRKGAVPKVVKGAMGYMNMTVSSKHVKVLGLRGKRQMGGLSSVKRGVFRHHRDFLTISCQ
jgi:hypothetical protein